MVLFVPRPRPRPVELKLGLLNILEIRTLYVRYSLVHSVGPPREQLPIGLCFIDEGCHIEYGKVPIVALEMYTV
jgi:hypothetical protein